MTTTQRTSIDCDETCKCGITYQTWVDYDGITCVDDTNHVWEIEDLDEPT